MKKLLLLLLLCTSVAFAQNEKMNIFIDTSPNPASISIIDINNITFDGTEMKVNTKDGETPFSMTAIRRITFTPPTLNIDVYFNMHNGEVITLKTSEFDELIIDSVANSVIDNGETVPGEVSFTKGYPNPFSAEISIEFKLEKPGNVEVSITDINGRHLKTLLADNLSQGSHDVAWNGLNSDGLRVGSGSYICSVKLNNIVVSKKLIFVN